jgi:MYXO-CTERM domain-containing protein
VPDGSVDADGSVDSDGVVESDGGVESDSSVGSDGSMGSDSDMQQDSDGDQGTQAVLGGCACTMERSTAQPLDLLLFGMAMLAAALLRTLRRRINKA